MVMVELFLLGLAVAVGVDEPTAASMANETTVAPLAEVSAAPEAPTPQPRAAPRPEIALRANLRGSLDATLRALTPSHGSALAAQMARLLRWHGDIVKDLHPGDEVRFVYTLVGDAPELVALEYAGTAVNLSAYLFEHDGAARFFDSDGVLVEPVLQNSPANAVQITETVQQGRGKRKHQGLDLKAPIGTPVRAPFAGVVNRVNWSTRVNGNCVEVALPGGRLNRFLHLSAIDPAVVPGTRIEVGAAIGAVGNTGRSSAPHLHYELRASDGSPLDPLREHGTTTFRLPEAERSRFLAERAQLSATLLAVARLTL